jgi:N,N-dimethylformamidase
VKITGYADRMSAAPGEPVEFRISSEAATYHADLVKLVRGGAPGRTHPPIEHPVPSPVTGDYPGRVQRAHAGSYVTAACDLAFPAWTATAWIFPTRTGVATPQTVLATAPGLALAVTPEGLALLGGDGAVLAVSGIALPEREWCYVAAAYDPAAGEVVFVQQPRDRTGRAVRRAADGGAPGRAAEVLAGARRTDTGAADHFNGKIARPALYTAALGKADLANLADPATRGAAAHRLADVTAVAWDLSADQAALTVPDRGPHALAGACANLPTRAVTGPNWTGAALSPAAAPAEYDAIHFHDDDLSDAGWDTDLTLTVPADLPSGVYALRVTTGGQDAYGDGTDRIPFVVRERPDAEPAPVLVLLPTWTYLAYANWRTYVEELEPRTAVYGEPRLPDPVDYDLVRHPEYGPSLYDFHTDGTGVAFSSYLRPIWNMRPTYFTPTTKGLRHFAADLYLIWWLERQGIPYAVATDHDLDAEGAALLRRHRVLVTGSHPEYMSSRMLDAVDAFTGDGGRLMYLGGNGFYWVTARHPAAPQAIEIRRGAGGRRVWDSEPGEEYLASTGEPGGVWRYRGRAPQRLTGVGMTAQGFDKASPYRRLPDSRDPAIAWVFDGLREDVFGATGYGLGGAAGDEIDRADHVLGTPRDAWILARSFGHSAKIIATIDEQERAISGAVGGGVGPHANVVAFGRPGGGAVFSVGSICWVSSMAYEDPETGAPSDVSRITRNVLDRFIAEDEPVPPNCA